MLCVRSIIVGVLCFLILSNKAHSQNSDNPEGFQNLDQAMLQSLEDICAPGSVIPEGLGDRLDLYCLFRGVFLIQPGEPGGATGSSTAQDSADESSRLLVKKRLEKRRKETEPNNDSDIETPKFGTFITLDYEKLDKNPTAFEAGFNTSRDGVILGFDYRVNPKLILGAAISHRNLDGDFNFDGGKFKVEQTNFLGYGSFQLNPRSYFDFMLGVTQGDHDINRRIVFIDTDSISELFTDKFVDAKTDSSITEASISYGSNYAVGGWNLQPIFTINYSQMKIDSFAEEGETALALTYSEQKENSLTANISGQISYAKSTNFGVVLPYVRLDYIHEFQQDQRNIVATFTDDLRSNPTPVIFANDAPDRNYMRLSVGVSSVFANGYAGFISFKSTLGLSDRDKELYVVGIRKEF